MYINCVLLMYLSALNCVHLTSIGNLLTHINDAETVYRVDQKRGYRLMTIILSNLYLFTKFFHWKIP